MTPKEKLDHIRNPQTLADFGLRISSKELKTFPEGKALDESIESRASIRNESKKLLDSIATRKNQLIINVIGECHGKTTRR